MKRISVQISDPRLLEKSIFLFHRNVSTISRKMRKLSSFRKRSVSKRRIMTG